tara:strand:+ start:56750 stop:57610 length:861 start_codon:yes stop_codon:yes gene_type:complete
MEKKHKVSVVITTYNRNIDLIKAIKSVQKQTYNNIEIIVVNDYEADNNKLETILEQFNVKLFNSNLGGANAARLLGFQNATGKYISFLDDDDYWVESKIENQVNLLEANNNAILVTSDARVFYQDGTLGGVIHGNSNKHFLDYRNFFGGFSFPCIKKEYIKESYFWIGLESAQDYYFYLCLRNDNPTREFIQTNSIELYYQQSNIKITNSKPLRIKGFLKVYNYFKSTMPASAINWHKVVKHSSYGLGKPNKIKFILFGFVNYNYLKLLLYVSILKINKIFKINSH